MFPSYFVYNAINLLGENSAERILLKQAEASYLGFRADEQSGKRMTHCLLHYTGLILLGTGSEFKQYNDSSGMGTRDIPCNIYIIILIFISFQNNII